MSDRIAVMRRGQIVELGAADDVYRNPRDPYTRRCSPRSRRRPAADADRTRPATQHPRRRGDERGPRVSCTATARRGRREPPSRYTASIRSRSPFDVERSPSTTTMSARFPGSIVPTESPRPSMRGRTRGRCDERLRRREAALPISSSSRRFAPCGITPQSVPIATRTPAARPRARIPCARSSRRGRTSAAPARSSKPQRMRRAIIPARCPARGAARSSRRRDRRRARPSGSRRSAPRLLAPASPWACAISFLSGRGRPRRRSRPSSSSTELRARRWLSGEEKPPVAATLIQSAPERRRARRTAPPRLDRPVDHRLGHAGISVETPRLPQHAADLRLVARTYGLGMIRTRVI